MTTDRKAVGKDMYI
ncbi:hypothetical protein ES1_02490 [[Eubacterium] siraeum V10Sc8a]|uniref:Uncharacterized protein n=2 Tax=[Eubacterium] siraeum TaxID=39492 RepID=D4MI43_9FIRM|nr:hypothetical protein EUS_20590 [[Eubacterium] siraeum 70/3]CBL33426.1 hypothetical protein ES1_02490 [[Eubacterium] siraeum V10Sc8a]